MLTIRARSVQNLQVAALLLMGTCSNFIDVEGSTASLHNCPQFFSSLYRAADRCFDCIPVHHKDTLMYADPYTRQAYVYALPMTCDNNPELLNSIPNPMIKIFTFLASNQLNENHNFVHSSPNSYYSTT